MSKYAEKMFFLREKSLNRRSSCPILRNRRAFKIAIEMLADGHTYEDVAARLNNTIPEFRTSQSSVGRFWNFYKDATYGK